MTANDVVRAARVLVNRKYPYLQAALWTMQLVEEEACPTMGVSKDWVCYYNPTQVMTWGVEASATVLIHELWHLLRGHHERAKRQGVTEINAEPWNMAADAEINDGLMGAKLPFPENLTPITPALLKMPDGLLAEEYYARMPRTKSPRDGGQSIGGSGADGIQRSWESGGGGQEKSGRQKNGPAQRVVPAELIKRQVAEAIARHAGTWPGSWKRWSGAVTAVKHGPWQQIFRQVVGNLIASGRRDEYTYARPARRDNPLSDFVLPGNYGTLPDVLLIADTSGSMGEHDLAEAVSILESVLEYLGRVTPLQVIAGDTRVQAVTRTLTGKHIDLSGGGGTDMCALLRHAETVKPRPQVVIVVTDGYTPWPERAPAGFQTVIVLTQPNEAPRWATVIQAGKGK